MSQTEPAHIRGKQVSPAPLTVGRKQAPTSQCPLTQCSHTGTGTLSQVRYSSTPRPHMYTATLTSGLVPDSSVWRNGLLQAAAAAAVACHCYVAWCFTFHRYTVTDTRGLICCHMSSEWHRDMQAAAATAAALVLGAASLPVPLPLLPLLLSSLCAPAGHEKRVWVVSIDTLQISGPLTSNPAVQHH